MSEYERKEIVMYNLSIIVNIVLSIASFVLAAISIVFVIIALRQNKKLIEQNNRTLDLNNKMLEESTRPYITIYLDAITICEQNSFFVLKNFGHSAATITRFDYSECLKASVQQSPLHIKQFDYVRELTLAPGQSKMLHYDVTTLKEDIVSFVIGYVHNDKYYEETITMNAKNYIHIPVPRPDSYIPGGNDRSVHSLRELIERSI